MLSSFTGDAEVNRQISELMIEQVEFANVVLLNKSDVLEEGGDAGKKELLAVEGAVRGLNPHAKILKSVFGNVEMSNLVDTKLFDMAKFESDGDSWMKTLLEKADKKVRILTLDEDPDRYFVEVPSSRLMISQLRLYFSLGSLLASICVDLRMIIVGDLY